MKLANRISLSIFIVAFFSVVVSFAGLYFLVKDDLKTAIAMNLESTVRSRAAHIETYLQMLKISVGQMSKSIVLSDVFKARDSGKIQITEELEIATVRLKRTKEVNPSISEFLLLDKTGKVIAATDKKDVGSDRSGDAFFLGARTKIFIKDAYYSQSFKMPAMAVSAPFLDEQTGALRGVIVAVVSLDNLNAICLEKAGLGKTGEIYIVNKYGFMITESRFSPGTFLKQKVNSLNMKLVRMHTGPEHAVRQKSRIFSDYRGVRVLGAHEYIPEMQWAVLGEMNVAEAFAPMISTLRFTAIFLIVVPFFALFSGFLVSRAMTRELEKLHEGVSIIGSGNLDYKVTVSTGDEIGRLARAFNGMTENLKTTTTSVENLKNEIAEREQAEESLRKLAQELHCLYSVADVIEKNDDLEQILQKTVELMPSGWFHGDITCACITFEGKQYKTRNFRRTDWRLSANLGVAGRSIGEVELCYLEKQPAGDEGPFLKGERDLINAIAERLGRVIERKQAEEALRESEERYRALFMESKDAMMTTLPDKGFLSANPAAVKMFNCRDEKDFVSRTPAELSPECQPDGALSSEKSRKMMMLALEKGSNFFEWVHKRVDGAEFQATVLLSKVEKGGAAYLQATVRDITEQKQREKKLQELSIAVEQSPVCVVITDTKGDIEYINPKFAQLTGYTQEEVKGKNPRVLKSGEQSGDFYKELWSTIAAGKEWRGEFHNKKKTGELYWESAVISPIRNKEGVIVNYIAVKEDITARKKAEEVVREAIEAKSKFTSMVSHELRTPLSAIKEGINLVAEGVVGGLNDQQKSLLGIAKNNVDRLARLINNVLDFQKMEWQKAEFVFKRNDINKVAMEVVRTMELLAEKKGLTVTADLGGDIPEILFDKDRISQVLTNLMNNAIKLTDQGNVSVHTRTEGNMVRVTVRDTGPGIREEDIKRLFQPFEQLDSAGDKRKGGSGLGLAISRDIINAHRGRIWAESEFGKGSAFHFTLPIKERRG